jgi:PKD repeat protein
MRVMATADASCLSIAINPSSWQLFQGPTLTLAYRIPAGVPVGLVVNVTGHGQLFLGGSPTASPGLLPAVAAVQLLDDDQWHTVTVDLYHQIRQYWPEASRLSQLIWWTDANAPAGAQFWFDDVQVTRRTYVSGFTSSPLPPTGSRGRGVDAADVHVDGHIDLARGRSSDGQIALYTGDGTGQFSTSIVADPGNDPYGVVLADVDNDGRIDLIANNGSSGDPYLFKGNGDGTFQAGTYIASLDTNHYAAYAAYDFNHDGHQDMVVVNNAGQQVLVYPGKGDGTFMAPVQIGTTQAWTLGVAAPAGRIIGQPFAVVTVDADTIAPGDTITFDATASFDDGSIVSSIWDFGDGSTASGSLVSHAYAFEGMYTAVLTLIDDQGKQTRHQVRITVKGAPPVADAGGPYTVHAGVGLTLDASASLDPEGPLVHSRWDLNDDGVFDDATGLTQAITYGEPGVFPVALGSIR